MTNENILDHVVVKTSDWRKYEKPEFVKVYWMYRKAVLGQLTVSLSRKELVLLSDFLTGLSGRYTESVITSNFNSLPVYTYYDRLDTEEQELVDIVLRDRVIDDYVEYNSYFRQYLGLPRIDENLNTVETEFTNFSYPNITVEVDRDSGWVYIVGSHGDIKIPNLTAMHLLDETVLSLLVIEETLLASILSHFECKKYLQFIINPLDLIRMRDSNEYDLVEVTIYDNETVVSLFKEIYNKEKMRFKATYYNDFDQYTKSYYEEFNIMFLLMSALFKLEIEICNINDVYLYTDADLNRYMASYGIPEYVLPVDIKLNFVKTLRKMKKLKGTDQVLLDFKSIFKTSDIYQYYFHKMIADRTAVSKKDKYDLKLIKVPLGESVKDYILKPGYQISAEQITKADKTWGSLDLDGLKEKNFTTLKSKYISFENQVDIMKTSYESSTLLYCIFENAQYLDDAKVSFSEISEKVNIYHFFIYTICILNLKNGLDDVVPNPGEMSKLLGISPDQNISDLRQLYHIHYATMDSTKKKALEVKLGRQGIASVLDSIKIINSPQDTSSIIDMYESNKRVLDFVLELMQVETDSCRYDNLLKIFRNLSTVDNNAELWKHKKKYSDILNDDSASGKLLYSRYLNTVNQYELTDGDNLYNEINYIINTLDDITFNSVDNFISFLKSNVQDSIRTTLVDLISHFKSYTVEVLTSTTNFNLEGIDARIAITDGFISNCLVCESEPSSINDNLIMNNDNVTIVETISTRGDMIWKRN